MCILCVLLSMLYDFYFSHMFCFFFSSRRRHTRCALVTGVQTCALPISTELPNIPRWLNVRITADGREITPRKGKLLDYRRYLDMKRAVLVREFRVRRQDRKSVV